MVKSFFKILCLSVFILGLILPVLAEETSQLPELPIEQTVEESVDKEAGEEGLVESTEPTKPVSATPLQESVTDQAIILSGEIIAPQALSAWHQLITLRAKLSEATVSQLLRAVWFYWYQGAKVVIGQLEQIPADGELSYDWLTTDLPDSFGRGEPLSWSDTPIGFLPQEIAHGSLVVVGADIYLLGGQNEQGAYLDTIYQANLSSPDNWQDTGHRLPEALSSAQVIQIGDELYLFGGYGPGTEVGRNIYRSHISYPFIWQDTGALLPDKLYGSQVAWLGDYLYLFGGHQGADGLTANIYRAPVSDPTNWENSGAQLPQALAYSHFKQIGNKLYLFGGLGERGIYQADSHDPLSWEKSANELPDSLGMAQLAEAGDYLYLVGGLGGSTWPRAHQAVSYQAKLSQPTDWQATDYNLPVALSGSSLLVIDHSFYLFGGVSDTGRLATIYRANIGAYEVGLDLFGQQEGQIGSAGSIWLILDHQAPRAIFASTTATTTLAQPANFAIGGAGVSVYRYRVDSEDYSEQLFPVSQWLELTYPLGVHQVCVIGGDGVGNWQVRSQETCHSWWVIADNIVSSSTTNYLLDQTAECLVIPNGISQGQILVSEAGAGSSLDLSQLVSFASSSEYSSVTVAGEWFIQATTSLGQLQLFLPDNLTISAGGPWDGTMLLPKVDVNNDFSLNLPDNYQSDISAVVELGFDQLSLSFDRGVRLLIPGQAGQLLAYSHGDNVTLIETLCQADNQLAGDALPAGGDCYLTKDDDLVIWTKHFTKFVTYSQTEITPITPGSSSGGGSSSNNNNSPSTSNSSKVSVYDTGGKVGLAVEQSFLTKPNSHIDLSVHQPVVSSKQADNKNTKLASSSVTEQIKFKSANKQLSAVAQVLTGPKTLFNRLWKFWLRGR